MNAHGWYYDLTQDRRWVTERCDMDDEEISVVYLCEHCAEKGVYLGELKRSGQEADSTGDYGGTLCWCCESDNYDDEDDIEMEGDFDLEEVEL